MGMNIEEEFIKWIEGCHVRLVGCWYGYIMRNCFEHTGYVIMINIACTSICHM